jgi:DUF971 family protein
MTPDEFIQQALSQPLTSDAFRPTNLHLDRKDGLKIEWADGSSSHYPLAYLRKHCPCATCRTEREECAQPKPTGLSLTILPANIDKATQFTSAQLAGNYAIQITWADGHSTGIYDFRYLRAIDPANPSVRP